LERRLKLSPLFFNRRCQFSWSWACRAHAPQPVCFKAEVPSSRGPVRRRQLPVTVAAASLLSAVGPRAGALASSANFKLFFELEALFTIRAAHCQWPGQDGARAACLHTPLPHPAQAGLMMQTGGEESCPGLARIQEDCLLVQQGAAHTQAPASSASAGVWL
jgi:hypothetical protein